MSEIVSIEPATNPLDRARAGASLPVHAAGDRRTVFRGVDWHTYHQLSEAVAEGAPVRLVYDGEDLEIMVTGNLHEHYKELLAAIVRAVSMGRELDYVSCGQAIWRTPRRGLEAHLSYCFDSDKVRARRDALARGSNEPADYPPPDLAIEIDMSPPRVDRPSVYRDLGVAEVWRLERADQLVIEQLQADGSYHPAEESRFLRIRPGDVMGWLDDARNQGEAAWIRRLNQWALRLSDHA